MSAGILARFYPINLSKLPRWLDVAFWLVATLLFARLIYLPQARALGKEDAISAASGQWLVLDGIAQNAAINIKVPLAGSADLSAPRASVDRQSQIYLKSVGVLSSAGSGALKWAASSTGPGASSLIAILSSTTPDARIALSAAGGGKGLRLRVDRGSLAISVRLETDSTARGLIDAPGTAGQYPYAPWQPLTFVVDPGAPVTLNFASSASPDIWLQGDGVNEGPLPITAVELGADDGTLARTCGGPAGAIMLWSVLFQPRAYPIPDRDGCRSGYMVVGTLAMDNGNIVTAPSGSAYLAGELPLLSDLKSNLALKALILAILAYPGARLMGLIKIGDKAAKPSGGDA